MHIMISQQKNLLLTMILVTAISCAAQGTEPVYFADPNLKAAVEGQLGVVDPTPTDMFFLSTLNANNRGITDLTG
ncbi:hypothetical protein MUO98_01330, partial [Candidatus Bathyarchaeota archaeon]|nr:hypothetical protein [Candidatus Bathyarchaeota archaeon]